jgi:tetratricopeptide (TPR) repeat protein
VGTLEILAALKVRAGAVSEGRELYRDADRLYRELGMRYREAVNWQCWGRSELVTGDCAMAETAFRESIEEFEQMGDAYYAGGVRALLAHALCDQGRHDDAAAVLDLCEGPVMAPSARARVLAARAELEEALALVRQALAASAELDWPEARAQVLVSLAEVWRTADQPAEEATALGEALELYKHKGIKPAVERVRARLAELGTVSAT